MASGYRVRIAAFVLIGVPIGLHLHAQGHQAGLWALFVLQFLVYPHALHWLTRRAWIRGWTEFNNMLVDSVHEVFTGDEGELEPVPRLGLTFPAAFARAIVRVRGEATTELALEGLLEQQSLAGLIASSLQS